MALTKDFRETVQARVQHDKKFRRGLLSDAVEALLGGENALGREILATTSMQPSASLPLRKKPASTSKHYTRCLDRRVIRLPLNSSTSLRACRSMKACGCRWWRKKALTGPEVNSLLLQRLAGKVVERISEERECKHRDPCVVEEVGLGEMHEAVFAHC